MNNIEQPDKDHVCNLLNKTHTEGVPDWTSAEQQEAYRALQALYVLWFRSEL